VQSWWFYLVHGRAGISAATGRPFPPPSDFQDVPRPNAAKKERTEVLHGKCQKCRKWVPVEGVKDVESKVRLVFVCDSAMAS
jgi:hypothetical protein